MARQHRVVNVRQLYCTTSVQRSHQIANFTRGQGFFCNGLATRGTSVVVGSRGRPTGRSGHPGRSGRLLLTYFFVCVLTAIARAARKIRRRLPRRRVTSTRPGRRRTAPSRLPLQNKIKLPRSRKRLKPKRTQNRRLFRRKRRHPNNNRKRKCRLHRMEGDCGSELVKAMNRSHGSAQVRPEVVWGGRQRPKTTRAINRACVSAKSSVPEQQPAAEVPPPPLEEDCKRETVNDEDGAKRRGSGGGGSRPTSSERRSPTVAATVAATVADESATVAATPAETADDVAADKDAENAPPEETVDEPQQQQQKEDASGSPTTESETVAERR